MERLILRGGLVRHKLFRGNLTSTQRKFPVKKKFKFTEITTKQETHIEAEDAEQAKTYFFYRVLGYIPNEVTHTVEELRESGPK